MTTHDSDATRSDRPRSRAEQLRKKAEELTDEVQRMKELLEHRDSDKVNLSEGINQKAPNSQT